MKALKGVLIGSLLGALLLLGAPSSALADKSDRWDKNGQDAKAGDPHNGDNKGAPGHGGDNKADKGDKKDDNKKGDSGHDRDSEHRDRGNDDYYYDGSYYGPDYCGYYGRYRGGYGYYEDCGGYYGESTSTFYANMSGDQVVPKPGPPGAKGKAQLDVNPSEHRVCFKMAYDGIDHPTGAHIHRGRPGENGPMAVDLHLEASGNQGCAGAPYGVLRAMQADPHGFYLQLHTHDFPDGVMRGQLFSPGEGGY